AISYTVSPSSIATISGSTITTTGVGTVTVTATQAATTDYAAATVTTSFTVGQATPTLTLASIANQSYGTPVTATAASASPGAITYTVSPAALANISGSTITPVGVGTVIVTASQAATTDYAAATATTSFTVAAIVNISAITPAAETIAPQNVTFSATAAGGSTDALTWTASGGTFNGSVWTAPDTAGIYTITATSVEEPSVSATTTITVSKPVITAQPMSINACAGYSPSLAIAANYATSYQWSFNGSTLVNNSPTLSFSNASTVNSGTYACKAINAAGTATSNTVTLNVVTPTTLTLTTEPSSVSVYATQTATFSVGATGTGTLTYQWYTGAVGSGIAISDATSSTYTTGVLTAANNGTTYYVTVTDADCTSTTLSSTGVTVTVSTTDTAVPPTIIVQPLGETATVGGTAIFSVTASGSGTLTYQWYRVAYSSTELSNPTAGVLVSGATGSTYTVPTTATSQSNDGDNYFVVVKNAYGSATSSRVVLAVGSGILLQLSNEPQTEYVAANTLASFSVTATCTGCTPAYKWYWYAPGSTTATALSNGAVSSGTLSGATVSGATTSSLTLTNAPTTASGAIFYVVITSTSDGTSQNTGTNTLTSSTAGLFVGSLGIVGNGTAGDGLCNSATTTWKLNGTNPGTASGDVPFQDTSACTIELTSSATTQHAAVYWPTLISTAKLSVSFTVAISATSTPADGFTMILADPSQGATITSVGNTGEGMGAAGIPGFVLGFDTYQNGNTQTTSGCFYAGTTPCDPIAVPYMAVGQGASALWENPWTSVNGYLNTQSSADYSKSVFANATHSYVVTVVDHLMTVTMDGYELFTGTVSLPPAAYLGFTASTGGSVETVTVSALTATISAP
ncbi:MAG: beta strand repeat-containing protein, partial [Janthinobacterium lividum]